MLTQLLLICLVFPFYASAEDYIEATATDFDSIIRTNDLTLVKFYAEWCGHCKRMAPDFAKAATELKNNVHPVTLVKVNCPNHQDLCQRYGVSGYPTLKIFPRGELQNPRQYDGPRDAAGIVKYMKGQAGPDSILIGGEDEIASLIAKSTNPVFVAFVSDASDPMFTAFESLAREFRERFTFAHIFKSKKSSIRRYLPKLIQTKLEPAFEEISSTVKHDELRQWLLDVWGGMLAYYTDEPPTSNMETPLVTVYFECDYERDPKGSNYIRNRVLKVIKQLKEEKVAVRFGMAAATKNERLLDSNYNLKWKKGDKPVVTGHHMSKKYVMRDEFSYEALKKWAADLSAGKLEAYLKSEPLPEGQKEAVAQVVALNFDKVVRDQSKNVLIEFYAPWCGHCKNLKPVYEELAQKVKDKSDIVIAAMDATANDVPTDFAVSGFPTLYWVNKKNEISPYEGGRTVKDFLQFLESKTDHTFAHDEL